MLPRIVDLEFDNALEEQEDFEDKSSFLFDFNKGDFVLKDGKFIEISKVEALKQWVEMVIRTERYRYEIYKDENNNDDHGIQLEDLFGYDISFAEEEIKRELTERLIKDKRINSLSNWKFERDGSTVKIMFAVDSIYGEHKQEVSIFE